jgi:poly-gamma-glutamate capsule biosynthesis protein CapA/YwtB (metallophosphatase superfamily)
MEIRYLRPRLILSAAVLVACVAIGSAGGAAVPLRVVLTGQSLIDQDLRKLAPDIVEGAKVMGIKADVFFTNFEGVIRGEGPVEQIKASNPGVKPETLDTLRAMGFNLLALSNNHAWDLATGGILDTLREAGSRGFVHAGTGKSLSEAAAPAILDTPHGRVALVAFASGSLDERAGARADRPGVNELRVDAAGQIDPEDGARILAAIRQAARQAAAVLVYHHNHMWKEGVTEANLFSRPEAIRSPETAAKVRAVPLEERTNPLPWMQRWTRACIDAGATIYITHGAPALHGIEIYRGRAILYGLGNFIFQVRSDTYIDTAWWSVVVDAGILDGRVVALTARPIILNDKGRSQAALFETRGMPQPATDKRAAEILQAFARMSATLGTEVKMEASKATVVIR